MKEKYNNRKSIRIKNYDYSKDGMYFITICVKERKELLSKININLNISEMVKNITDYVGVALLGDPYNT